MLRNGAILCVALLGVLSAGSALAQSAQSLSLKWDAPEVCPTVDEVRSDVLRLVGNVPAHSTLSATAVVGFSDGVWWLKLETDLNGQLGERHLQAPTCETVANAAAVTLALMLNPSPEGEDQADPPAPPQSPPAPRPQQPTQSAAEPAPEPPFKKEFGLTATLGSGLGNLAAPDPELSVGAALSVERWLFSLSAFYGLPQTSAATGLPAAGSLSFGALRIRSCFVLLDRGWTLSPCVGLGVAAISGRGTGIESPKSGSIFWAELGAGVRVTVPLTNKLYFLGLMGIEGAAAPSSRPRVFIEDVNDETAELRRAAALTGHAHIGVQWQMW